MPALDGGMANSSTPKLAGRVMYDMNSVELREPGPNFDMVLKACRVEPETAKLVEEWRKKKIEGGVPEYKCALRFLDGAPKLDQCRVCQRDVCQEESVSCSVRGCRNIFHLLCAKKSLGLSSSKQFKCPQHACFLCKQKNRIWRCVRCPMACHKQCAPFPEHVVHVHGRADEAICWRHSTDWHSEKAMLRTYNDEDIFSSLPLPYIDEEFKADVNWKEETVTKLEPDSYVHIKRNVHLVKKKHSKVDADTGCAGCSSSQCSDGCVCRVQSISCSKACHCSKDCKNRPFRKEKKIKIVKTEHCGWGVVAAESIRKEDFIIEYVGEVIDDALCEKRLWDMKEQGLQNFYMCEINKDFVIDATFKGNSSRFLNHSCAPNCRLEKWQVNGKTRVGIFASRSIEVGEPLTYDYRFVQFGPEVECHCGAPKCQGYLGTTKKVICGSKNKTSVSMEFVSWGTKRQRTSTRMMGLLLN